MSYSLPINVHSKLLTVITIIIITFTDSHFERFQPLLIIYSVYEK